MKILVILALLWNSLAFAECDWATIKTQKNDKGENEYVYTKECHIQVGVNKEELDIRKKQLAKQAETIKLSELGINIANQRAEEWKEETYDQRKALERSVTLEKYTSAGYFLVGIGTAMLSVWAVGKLGNR